MTPLSLLLILALLAVAGCDRVPRDAEGTPLLHHAAERGDLAQLDELVAGGTPVNARDLCQRTPLMLAAQAGRLDTARELLARGAYVDLHEKGSYTALLLAASNGHTGVVELLARHGANVNEVERTNGWTALIWAAKRGHEDTVRALLELGADSRIRDQRGRDAAGWASASGHAGVAALLRDAGTAAPPPQGPVPRG
jgi:ankyrin repeat protein